MVQYRKNKNLVYLHWDCESDKHIEVYLSMCIYYIELDYKFYCLCDNMDEVRSEIAQLNV